MLDSRTRPPGGRPISWRVTLLALLVLVAVPAAAEAKNLKVDGHAKGAPTAKGGAVTLPLQLNLVVAIAAAVAIGLLMDHRTPQRVLPEDDLT